MTVAELLQPVFHCPDRMIREYGDVLYIMLVYASIPLIAWILSGGLRRKQTRQLNHTSIIVIWPLVRPPPLPPPIIGRESSPPRSEERRVGKECSTRWYNDENE